MHILPKILYALEPYLSQSQMQHSINSTNKWIFPYGKIENPAYLSCYLKLKPFQKYKHMHMRGLSLPNIQAYHFVAKLDQIRYWWQASPDKNWSLVESPYDEYFWLKRVNAWPTELSEIRSLNVLTCLHYSEILEGIVVWQIFPVGGFSRSNPLTFRPIHIPDLCVDSWIEKGLLTLNNLYDVSQIKTFSELQTCYNLPSSDF